MELFAYRDCDVVQVNNCLIKYYLKISVTCAVAKIIPTWAAGSLPEGLFVL